MKLLLASRSATRRRMLEAAGVPFDCVDSPIDEEAAKAAMDCLDAETLAIRLAQAKALAVPDQPGVLILGADQTCELADGTILSKPESPAQAREQLQRMSGESHRLHAAAVIAENGEVAWRQMETVTLTMRPLGPDFIDSYLAAEFEHIRWNAGGYRIEGPGVQLFERIEGSHFAILGLPLLPLLRYLRERGVLAS